MPYCSSPCDTSTDRAELEAALTQRLNKLFIPVPEPPNTELPKPNPLVPPYDPIAEFRVARSIIAGAGSSVLNMDFFRFSSDADFASRFFLFSAALALA